MTVRNLSLFFFAVSSIALSACQRDLSGSSSISIQLPTASELAKVSAFAFPVGQPVCFGISVSATDLAGFAGNSCAPKTGLVKGFVPQGGTIIMDVPRGNARKIDLYAYLLPAGSTAPCPAMPANMGGSMSLSTYLVGSVSGVDTIEAETRVSIVATFPGASSHIANQISAPASCTAASVANAAPGFRIRSGSGVATGSGYQMSARIGQVSGSNESTGGSYKVKGKIINF